jgi:hypothetical protein
MHDIVNAIEPGDILYYPSNEGIALICEVIDKSEKDVLVDINGKSHYLPKASVNNHGILIDKDTAAAYITQRLEDPDNRIIYLRYVWKENWVDRAYNTFCQKLDRIDEPIIVPSHDEGTTTVKPAIDPAPGSEDL